MTGAEAQEIGDLLDRIRTWSPPRRITLARRILETLDAPAIEGHEDRPVGDSGRAAGPR